MPILFGQFLMPFQPIRVVDVEKIAYVLQKELVVARAWEGIDP